MAIIEKADKAFQKHVTYTQMNTVTRNENNLFLPHSRKIIFHQLTLEWENSMILSSTNLRGLRHIPMG